MLRLLHFSEKVKNLLISGELTTGQARPILALESIQEQDSAAEYILKSGLNARQAEQYVKKLAEKSKQKSQSEEKDISEQIKQQEVRFVQDRLRTSLGTKVILNDHNGRGKITIEYYSKDERERLIEFLTKK